MLEQEAVKLVELDLEAAVAQAKLESASSPGSWLCSE